MFVKLILPPSLSMPTGIGYWVGDSLSTAAPVLERLSNTEQQESATVATSEYPRLSGDVPLVQPSRTVPEPTAPIAPAVWSLPSLTWRAVAFLLWLPGASVISFLLVRRIRYVRQLIAQSTPVEGRLLEMLNQCRQDVGIRRNIQLRLSTGTPSPAVCGLFKPTILMPAALSDKLPADKLRAALIHELAHIKRGDLWVNSVQTLLQVAYFYNPLVWLANAVVRRIREQAVDEVVLVTLGAGAKNYSNTLIDIAEMAFSRPRFSLGLVSVVESKKALTRRIKHILSRPIPKTARLGILGLLTIIVTASVLLPMARADRDVNRAEAEKDPEPLVAKLSNGVTAELLGVCEHPGKGKQWWHPDGSGFTEIPFSKFNCKVYPDDTEQAREMALRLWGPDNIVNQTDVVWKIPNCTSSSGNIGDRDEDGNQIQHTRAVAFKCDVERHSLDFRVAVAAGTWKSVASAPPGGGTMNDSLNDRTVMFYPAYERDGLVVVSIAHLIDQMKSRLVAVDDAGQIYTAMRSSASKGGELTGSTYTFELPLSRIRSFQLQARPYEWVTFRNVSLRPGVKTDVQVEIEGEMVVPQKVFDLLPNIFIMEPSRRTFSIFSEVVSLSQDWVWNKTGRQHSKKSYDEIFDGTHNITERQTMYL
ncbi:MAG: M56 family metallopeptidase [Planctomycetota bacterium]